MWFERTSFLVLAALFVVGSGEAAEVPGNIPNTLVVGANGALEYSIPIPMVPGTAGMEPKLTLAYNSQAPGGAMGAGWTVSGYSKVTRGPRSRAIDGAGGAVDMSATDALYLDGQRLVEVARSQQGSTKRVHFRKELDDQARVTATLDSSAQPSSFEVQTKGGLRLYLGRTEESKVTLAANATLVWLCDEIRDTAGNFMTWSYRRKGADYEVEAVRYTGHDSQPKVDPYAEVRFYYSDAQPSVTTYVHGTRISKEQRLEKIVSRMLTPALDVYSLDLRYEAAAASAQFRLKEVRYTASDGSFFRPITFSYSDLPNQPWSKSASFQLPTELAVDLPHAAFAFIRTETADGARNPALMYAAEIAGTTRSALYKNTANGWILGDKPLLPRPLTTSTGDTIGFHAMDLNGDGLDDLLYATGTSNGLESHAYLQSSGEFVEEPAYALPVALGQGNSAYAAAHADLDADGRQDLVVVDADGNATALVNTGSGWSASTRAISERGETIKAAVITDVDCDTKVDVFAVVASSRSQRTKVLKHGSGSWQELGTPWSIEFAAAHEQVAVHSGKAGTCNAVFLGVQREHEVLSKAYMGEATGLTELPALGLETNAFWTQKGHRVHPKIVDVNDDGLVDVLVSEVWEDGTSEEAAYLQLVQPDPISGKRWTAPGAADQLAPPFPIAAQGVERTAVRFLDLDGDKATDVIDLEFRAPGRVGAYLSNRTTWVPAASYSPPLEFARTPAIDLGLRFVDLNADGLVDILYDRGQGGGANCTAGAQERGAYLNRGNRWECVAGYFPPLPFPKEQALYSGVAIVDINNDGFVDLLYSYKDIQGRTFQSTFLNNFPSGVEGWTSESSAWRTPVIIVEGRWSDNQFQVVDVDGDARLDLLKAYTDDDGKPQVTYYNNDGMGFKPAGLSLPGTFGRLVDGVYKPTGSLLVDINGDRLPDFVERYLDTNTNEEISNVYISGGTHYTRSQAQVPVSLDRSGASANSRHNFTDINGDGLIDVYVYNTVSGAAGFHINTGNGWISEARWDLPAHSLSPTYKDAATRFIDINGDGLLDLIYHFATAADSFSKGAYFNTGAGWISAPTAFAPPMPIIAANGTDPGVRPMDVDGNGLPDMLRSLKTASGLEQETWLNVTARVDLMTAVESSDRIVSRLTYRSLGEYRPLAGSDPESVYEHGVASAYPSVSIAPAMYVVARLTTDEGNGRVRATRFRYGDLRVDLARGAALGFRWKDTRDEKTGVRTRTEFVQWPLLSGSILSERSWLPVQGADRLLSELSNEWLLVPSGGKHYWRRLINTATRSLDPNGDVLTSELTEFGGFDEFGNIGRTRSIRDDGSGSITENTYSSDPSEAALGRLLSARVRRFLDAGSEAGSCMAPSCEQRRASFSYDPQTLLLIEEIANADSPRYATRTRYVRDPFGNVVEKVVRALAGGVPERRETFRFVDGRGRLLLSTESGFIRSENVYESALANALGVPSKIIDGNMQSHSKRIDAFGRVIEETNAIGVTRESRIISIDAVPPEYLVDLDHARAIRPAACGDNAPATWAAPLLGFAEIATVSAKDGRGQKQTLSPTATIFDRAGRPVRNVSHVFDGDRVRTVFVDSEFDATGRSRGNSRAYFSGDPSYWTLSSYDHVGRLVVVAAADGACVQTRYRGRSTVLVKRQRSDGPDLLQEQVVNARGLVERIVDAGGGTNHYTYDAANRLVKLVGPTGGVRSFGYDDGGYRTRSSDPDAGTWAYEYDAFGQLKVQRDPMHLGQPAKMTYDAYGRLTELTTADHRTRWKYRGSGDSCGSGSVESIEKVAINAGIGPSFREAYGYDEFCRVHSVETLIGAGHQAPPAFLMPQNRFEARQEFDLFGRPSVSRYPRSFGTSSFATVQQYHPETGNLVQVNEWRASEQVGPAFWTMRKADATFHVLEEVLGPSLRVKRELEASTGRVTHVSANNDVGNIYDVDFSYDLLGNMLRRADKITTTQLYEYDHLDRLTRVRDQRGRAQTSVTYDLAGRIVNKSDVGRYDYGDACGVAPSDGALPLHAPCAIRNDQNAIIESYRYNRNGSMTRSPTANFYYTADNKLARVFQRNTRQGVEEETAFGDRFAYGPGGELFMQYTERAEAPGGFRAVATYKLGLYENEMRGVGMSRVLVDRFQIRAGSVVVGFVESTDYSEALTGDLPDYLALRPHDQRVVYGTKHLLVRDSLGSVALIVGWDGKPLYRFGYDPWGRALADEGPPVDRPRDDLYGRWTEGYTGHDHLAVGTTVRNLVHMGGRVMEARLGVFISPDPILTNALSTQDLNPYMYVLGNPLKYRDANGYSWLSDFIEDPLGSVVRAARNFLREAERAVSNIGHWVEDNWRELVGIVVAVVIVVYCPPCMANPMIGGFIVGAAQGATVTALYGGDSSQVLEASFRGGAVGAIGASFSFAAGEYISSSQVGNSSWQAAAAHGVAGGVTSVASGGRFESGFVSAAFTQTITQNTGIERMRGIPRYAANAALGGVTSEIGGDKFANGAMYGAFQAMFNDALHPSESSVSRSPTADGYPMTEASTCLGATAGIGASACIGDGTTDMQVSIGKPPGLAPGTSASVTFSTGKSGIATGVQAGFDACPAALCGAYASFEYNWSDPWRSSVGLQGKIGPFAPQVKIPAENFRTFGIWLEREIYKVYNVPHY